MTGTSIIIGELDPPMDGPLTVVETRTVRLKESHEIGPDGRPSRHRTVQTIQAVIDGVSTHRFVFDLAEARVENIDGGTPGDPYRIKASLWAVDLALPRTLRLSEQHTIEYLTTFRGDGPIEPIFRRAAHKRIENATIRVTFHPDCLPTRVWWAEWKDYREPNDFITARKPATLDTENAVQHHISVMDRAVAGFIWEFD
jgi:hypothetical protein